jgi:hypothetical protein
MTSLNITPVVNVTDFDLIDPYRVAQKSMCRQAYVVKVPMFDTL